MLVWSISQMIAMLVLQGWCWFAGWCKLASGVALLPSPIVRVDSVWLYIPSVQSVHQWEGRQILLSGLNVNTYLWNMWKERVSSHKRRAYISDVTVTQCEDVLHHICMHTMVGVHTHHGSLLYTFSIHCCLAICIKCLGHILAEIEIEELPEMILSSECGISTACTLPCGVCTLANAFWTACSAL